MVDGKPTIAIKGPFYDVKIMIMITVVAQTKSIKACPHHACTHTHTHTLFAAGWPSSSTLLTILT